jgi:hypothetical protein
MGYTGPSNEDAGKEVEEVTDEKKHGWSPDVGKEGSEKGHKASQNAFQGGGKGSSPSGETTAGSN